MERGWAAGASLETWACAAVAVGERLAAFLEHQPGASRPRDYEHLRRQQLIVDVATRGGWRAMPEQPIDADRLRSRSIDVFLERPSRREAAVTEIWDYFDDVGSSIRSFEDKLAALRRHFDVGADLARAPVAVGGLFVVRGTRRNRALVREFSSIFQARFPGSSVGWLAALTDPAAPIPNRPALIWTDVRGERLAAARL